MTTRILPHSEWDRLSETNMPLFGGVNPEDIDVVVVEKDGRIVAALTVLRVTHFEGAWVDPGRKGLGATRALLRLAKGLATARGDQWVLAGAEISDDRMARVLDRMGATRLPVVPYALRVVEVA